MAIKLLDFDPKITRRVKREFTDAAGSTITVTDKYALTNFVADSASDITAMNASGSEYLNYPAGSAVLCLADSNVYVLNASETAYVVPGGDE